MHFARPSWRSLADLREIDEDASQIEVQGDRYPEKLEAMTGRVTWIFLVGVVGLPYWIILIPLHDLLLSPSCGAR